MARQSGNKPKWKYWFKQPVVWVFGRKKTAEGFDFADVRSVLIRPTGRALGDAVVNSGYVRQLKTMYPQARIGVLVSDSNRAVFECCPQVDELVDEKLGQMLKQRGRWQVLLDMPDAFNTCALVGDKLLSPYMTMIFRKKNKPYYNTGNIRNFDFHCQPPEDAYMLDFLRCSEFARYFAVEPAAPFLNVPAEARSRAEAHWQSGKTRVLLCPQGSQRQLPAQELAALLDGVQARERQDVDWMLGNTRGSGDYLAQLQSLCGQEAGIRLAPELTLAEYIALVASCDILVGVDSGSVHVGCATGRPVLSFYANHSANLNRWRPMPQPGVPNLTVVSRLKGALADDTRDFPLDEASEWLQRRLDTKA